MGVLLHGQEFGGSIAVAQERAEPGESGHVGDRIVAARQIFMARQMGVEDVEQPLGLHRIAVDRIFHLERGIGVEMAEAAAEEGRRAHLPHQPVERLRPRPRLGRQERPELLGEIDEDRAALEQADGRVLAMVQHRRDLAVRIGGDEAGAELVAFADPDQPGVIFGARMAGREQLLEHDRDLHAIGRAERIELQRVPADRQFLLVRRPGNGPVDLGELAAAGLVPGPDPGRHIARRLVVGGIGGVGHVGFSVDRGRRPLSRVPTGFFQWRVPSGQAALPPPAPRRPVITRLAILDSSPTTGSLFRIAARRPSATIASIFSAGSALAKR